MTTTTMVIMLLVFMQPPLKRYQTFLQMTLEEPLQQQYGDDYQDNHHEYRYKPAPHMLTSLTETLLLTESVRQHEHDQKTDRQSDDHYAESPAYQFPPSTGRSVAE